MCPRSECEHCKGESEFNALAGSPSSLFLTGGDGVLPAALPMRGAWGMLFVLPTAALPPLCRPLKKNPHQQRVLGGLVFLKP